MSEQGVAIRLFHANLDSLHPLTTQLRSVLSERELAEVERCAPKAGLERTFSRAILRGLLGRELGITPRAVRLTQGPWGKPMLVPDCQNGLRFNVTHSGPHLLVALCVDSEVGIDVELCSPAIDVAELVAGCFSQKERMLLQQLEPPLQRHSALQSWTRKEAAAKADGRGFSLDPVEIETSSGDLAVLRSGGGESEPTLWFHLRDLDLGPEAVGCLACAVPIGKVEHIDLDLSSVAALFRS